MNYIIDLKKLTLFCLICSIFSACEQLVNSVPTEPEEAVFVNDKATPDLSPDFFSSDIPVDVDPVLRKQLKGRAYELNEAFNEFSWKAFIAIQWPRDGNNKPKPNFTDKGIPAWQFWKEAFDVYCQHGHEPAKWGEPRQACGLDSLPPHVVEDRDSRVFLTPHTPTHRANIADEVDQAFAGKLFDQNGNIVVYEVLMNKAEFDYIYKNQLYNINGQVKFAKKNNSVVNFPSGNYETGEEGAVEIKFAWKILEDDDIKERYFKVKGWVDDKDTRKYKKVTLGMIGFHISQKTPSAKQWVWSTFEHIDNLDQHVIEKDGKKHVIPPSLTDPNCEICPVNADVTHKTQYKYIDDGHGPYWEVYKKGQPKQVVNRYYANYKDTMKTQAKRMVDIPPRVRNINRKMQEFFKSQNSVWQYYQLIDTQYPTDQNAPPAKNEASNYVLPQAVTNKPGGKPNLALLTNITMETFFQSGNQPPLNLIESSPSDSLIQNRTIFGTESCMGCHSSAGLFIKTDTTKNKDGSMKIKGIPGGQLSGDFSWLLGKAKWNPSGN